MSNTPMEWLWQYARDEIENTGGDLDKAVASLKKNLIAENDQDFIYELTELDSDEGRTLTEACRDGVWGGAGQLLYERLDAQLECTIAWNLAVWEFASNQCH